MGWRGGEYEPRQKRAGEKKDRLLATALKLFGEKGFHRTTTKEIAAEAGVSTGSFYRYFRDKKAVFLGVGARLEAEMLERIFEFGRGLLDEGLAPAEVLTSFIRFSLEAHRENRGFHRELLVMEILDEDVARLVRAREARVRRQLFEFMRPLAGSFRVDDLEAAVELTYLLVEEVAHQAIIFDSEIGEKRLAAGLVDMVSRFLFPDKPPRSARPRRPARRR
ncbi:MAG: TetR/AcrR family transcriptional regulator [Thermodesulfobacteriota bacterium]